MKRMKKLLSVLLTLCLLVPVFGSTGLRMSVKAEETLNSSATVDYNLPSTWKEGDAKITLPQAPAGWDIALFGSDRKQVVALDGTVTRPLNDVRVALLYKLTNRATNQVIETRINTFVNITANPMEHFASGDNQKPAVIPSLREWKGGSGDLTVTDSSRIIVDSANYNETNAVHKKENLSKTADFYAQVNSFKNDLTDMTGLDLPIVTNAVPGRGDIYFTSKDAPETLLDQGYIIEFGGTNAGGDYTTVRAVNKTGILYGGITILQILNQTGSTLPKGIIRDYPEFEKRGYHLDVGRTFLPIEYLEDTMKQMAWYKMNLFSLHLSDNEIWDNLTLEQEVYAGFRLESNVTGLTSTDGYYTKDEFRELQYDGLDLGLIVNPELDTPGHALAYTRAWPELARDASGKYLDVKKPETLTKVKALFDEYIKPQNGEEEVFIGPYVNIGTDEYKNGDKEAFRSYTDSLLKYINSLGKKPAFWGSLLENDGTTPVTSNALMYAWYQGYADPKKSLNQGYDVLSMEDQDVYIVPGGQTYGNEFGRPEYLYNSWLPNDNPGWTSRSEGNKKSPAPLGHPRAVGGQFAVWNDWVGNGISRNDISFRVQFEMAAIAQKCWSAEEAGSSQTYKQFENLVNRLGDAPNCDFMYQNQSFTNDKVLQLESSKDIQNQGSVSLTSTNVSEEASGRFGSGIRFNGGSSHIDTNVTSTGFDWSMGMWINPDAANSEDVILMEGKTGTLKLRQGSTGKLGYSVDKLFDESGQPTVDKYNHYFNYKVPAGRWTHIALTGDAYGVKLYANGVFIDELRDKPWPNYNTAAGNVGGMPKYHETLMLPTASIGSKTNSFQGVIDDFVIYDRVLGADEIKNLAKISTIIRENYALNKTVTASGNEVSDGRFQYQTVVDGNKGGTSRWSSNTADDAWLTVDLGEEKMVGNVDIYWEAAYAKQYKIQLSTDGTTWTDVFTETNGSGGSPKSIEFKEQAARYVKYLGVERIPIGGVKYGYSFYEMEVYSAKDPTEGARTLLAQKINEANALLESGILDSNEELKSKLIEAVQTAGTLLTDPERTKDELEQAAADLTAKIPGNPESLKNLMLGSLAATTVAYWEPYSPSKMVDGDDSLTSRLATKKGFAEVPVEFVLPEAVTFNHMSILEGLGPIEGETLSEQINGYDIQIMKDGTYESLIKSGSQSSTIVGSDLSIDFGQDITANQIRILFEVKNSANAGININEVKLFQSEKPSDDVNETARDVVNHLTIPSTLDSSVPALPMPSVPAGYSVRLLSSSSPEIIAADGTIHHTSRDEKVTLLMEVSKPGSGTPQQRAVLPYVVTVEKETGSVSYTVTLNLNGGILSGPGTITVLEGQVIGKLPVPAKTGSAFKGWYDALEGGNSISETFIVNKDQTIYAHWESKPITKYIVTLNPNGGTCDPEYIQVEEGNAIGKLPSPSRYGYVFSGWYDAQKGGNVMTEDTVIRSNITIYAQWSEIVKNRYLVTLDSNGGSVSPDSLEVLEGTAIGRLPLAERNGYQFTGWYLSANGTSRVDESWIVTQNTTLYAGWKANPAQDPAQVAFTKGSYTLYATASVKTTVNANSAAGKVTGYRSENTKIAAVSSAGVIKGIQSGTTKIYVTTSQGATASVKVTVKKPKILLAAASAKLQKGKSTSAIKVKSKLSTDKITKYSSSNKRVATISNKGVIKAKKTGTTIITFLMKSGASAKCNLKVQASPVVTKSISVPGSLKLKVKQRTKLNVGRNPITATEKISFQTSNKKIASVSSSGTVTAKKKGRCNIKVSCNGKSKQVKVTVK